MIGIYRITFSKSRESFLIELNLLVFYTLLGALLATNDLNISVQLLLYKKKILMAFSHGSLWCVLWIILVFNVNEHPATVRYMQQYITEKIQFKVVCTVLVFLIQNLQLFPCNMTFDEHLYTPRQNAKFTFWSCNILVMLSAKWFVLFT